MSFIEPLSVLADEAKRSALVASRAWLDDGIVRAYIRIGKRYLRGSMRHGLTLANVEVAEEHQRKGHLKLLLTELEEFARERGFEFVFVEQVLNLNLSRHLDERGYEPYDHMDIMPEGLGDYLKLFA